MSASAIGLRGVIMHSNGSGYLTDLVSYSLSKSMLLTKAIRWSSLVLIATVFRRDSRVV